MDDSQRTFFITTVTWQRVPILRVEARARLLIEVLFEYRDQGRYLLHEFVVMPDHIHLLLTPAAEISLERAVQFIKGGYSYRLRKMEKIQVWQESFTNHRIRDAEDYERHCEYVRMNPVRAKLVGDASAYPFSSASSVFRMDAMPRGLKPDFSKTAWRGAEAPLFHVTAQRPLSRIRPFSHVTA
jgi:putative transposase